MSSLNPALVHESPFNLIPSTEGFVSLPLPAGVLVDGGRRHEKVYAVVGDTVIMHQYPFKIVLAS